MAVSEHDVVVIGAGHNSPDAGLYLSGAGTHPGGGVSGLPGKLAAEAVLRTATRVPQRHRSC